MFYNNPNFKKIGNDIYVYENFISKEELELINNRINSGIDLWAHNDPLDKRQHWSLRVEETSFIVPRLQSLIGDNYFVRDHANIIRLKMGDDWGLHSDNHEFIAIRELSKTLKDGEDFELVDNNIWGIVIYFNDFVGGEIFYPEQNIEYKPNAGDLVIHSSDEHCIHGVKPVLSDARYSHSNAIYEKIKVPINTV